MSGTMTSEDRIFEKLDAIEAKISAIAEHGCSHAWQHRAHEERLLKLEGTQAEMRGKAAVSGGIVAIAASAFFSWIGRQL